MGKVFGVFLEKQREYMLGSLILYENSTLTLFIWSFLCEHRPSLLPRPASHTAVSSYRRRHLMSVNQCDIFSSVLSSELDKGQEQLLMMILVR